CEWRIEFNKSGKTRYVPLSDTAISVLESIERIPGVDHIFFNPDTKLPYVNIFPAWDSVRKAARLKDVHLHDLRHTHASMLVNMGLGIYVVQRILGHSSVRTTERYSHLDHGTVLKATNVLSDHLKQLTAKERIVAVDPFLMMEKNGELALKRHKKESQCQKTATLPFTPKPSIGSSTL